MIIFFQLTNNAYFHKTNFCLDRLLPFSQAFFIFICKIFLMCACKLYKLFILETIRKDGAEETEKECSTKRSHKVSIAVLTCFLSSRASPNFVLDKNLSEICVCILNI